MASLDKFCKSVKVRPIGGRLLVPPKPKPPLPRPRPPRLPLPPPPPRDIPTTRRAWMEEDFFEQGLGSMRKVINNGRNRSVMDLNLRRPNKGEMICTAFHPFFPLPPPIQPAFSYFFVEIRSNSILIIMDKSLDEVCCSSCHSAPGCLTENFNR